MDRQCEGEKEGRLKLRTDSKTDSAPSHQSRIPPRPAESGTDLVPLSTATTDCGKTTTELCGTRHFPRVSEAPGAISIAPGGVPEDFPGVAEAPGAISEAPGGVSGVWRGSSPAARRSRRPRPPRSVPPPAPPARVERQQGLVKVGSDVVPARRSPPVLPPGPTLPHPRGEASSQTCTAPPTSVPPPWAGGWLGIGGGQEGGGTVPRPTTLCPHPPLASGHSLEIF